MRNPARFRDMLRRLKNEEDASPTDWAWFCEQIESLLEDHEYYEENMQWVRDQLSNLSLDIHEIACSYIRSKDTEEA